MVLVPRLARLVRVSLAVGLAATAALAWSATPGAAAEPVQTFTRTIEPDPAHPPSDESVPAFDITAACVRNARGGLEAVFGYESHGRTSRLVALDADSGHDDNANVIVRVISLGKLHAVSIEDLGPQVTLFKPGVHPYAFAVRYDKSDTVSWQVTVPELDEEGHGAFIETVTPVAKATCGRDAPEHFAVVQHVALEPPHPTNVARGPDDEVIRYDVEAGVQRMRATCSDGGQLLEPEVVQGWPAVINLEPVDADYFVKITLTGGPYFFDMTPKLVRSVPVDSILQPVEWLGPIADVSARCQFGDKAVVTGEPFWAELAGGGFIKPLEIIDGKFFEFFATQNSPVGSRLR